MALSLKIKCKKEVLRVGEDVYIQFKKVGLSQVNVVVDAPKSVSIRRVDIDGLEEQGLITGIGNQPTVVVVCSSTK